MKSFRFARRSFLAATGGAVGLRILLDNMTASAAGATSPPRFLMTHWPLGTVRSLFRPSGGGASYTPSPIIQPFVDAGLRDDMTVLYGLSHSPFDSGIGGGGEAGTVMMATGQAVPGLRANGGEVDDAVAAGPSFDQIFLKNVPALRTFGRGFVSAICEARVDSFETSTRCLSYGHDTRAIATPSGGVVQEAIPLLPELSPRKLYASLFADFMPGGANGPNQEALMRARKNRKSVLDFALRELDRIETLAPGGERHKIEIHAAAIRELERRLDEEPLPPDGGCLVPPQPDASIIGKTGSPPPFEDDPSETAESDEGLHAQVGRLHMDIIIAAMQCDLIRVATFQWSPASNRVSFKGLYPGRPEKNYQHQPTSRLLDDLEAPLAATLPDGSAGDILRFLANVQTWYNTEHAALLKKLKDTSDAFGNSLLDHTIVPYLTEVASCANQRSPLPAFVFGGKALGMRHGSYLDFEANPRCHNDLWMTVAQAYLGADPLSQLASESFHESGVQPIEGMWQAP